MLPEVEAISKKKVTTCLAVATYATRGMFDLIQVSRSKKHCAVYLFCGSEEGSADHSLAVR